MSSDEAVEALCRLSHEAYERAAAESGWATNPASRTDWNDVPEANKIAMRASVVAVAAAVRAEAVAEQAKLDQAEQPINLTEMRRWAHKTPDRFARDAVLACADEVERAHRIAGQAVADKQRRVLRELAALAKSDGEEFIVGWLNAVEDGDEIDAHLLAAGSVPAADRKAQADALNASIREYQNAKPATATAPAATPPAEPGRQVVVERGSSPIDEVLDYVSAPSQPVTCEHGWTQEHNYQEDLEGQVAWRRCPGPLPGPVKEDNGDGQG